MTALRACFRSLTADDLFSRAVVIGVALELLLVQLASPFTGGSPLLRSAVQLAAVAAIFCALRLVHFMLRGRVSDEVLRWVLVLAVPVFASGGGALLGAAFRVVGIDDDSLLALRIFSTCMHVTAMTVLLWTAVSSLRHHYARLERLREEQERLRALGQQVQHQLSAVDGREIDAVRARITADLTSARPASAPEAIALLTATIERVVRPLSRQLESQAETWSWPESAAPRPLRIDWWGVARAAMSPALISPAGVILVLCLIATPMNLARSGALFHLGFLAVVAGLGLPTFQLLRSAALRHAAQGGGRIPGFLVTTLTTGLVIAVALLPLTTGSAQPWRFFVLAPSFTLLIATVWGFAVAAKNQALESEHALRQAKDELAWALARARETHRQNRRALAHAVHGEVQAAIAAGILQLDVAMKSGSATPALVREVQDRVLRVVTDLDPRHADVDCLDGVLRKLRAAWSGVAEISLDADAAARSSAESDEQLMVTLNDVLPELVYNSIRHGSARHIAIELTRRDARALALTVTDDGRADLKPPAAGMGTRLLDDCALEWERLRRGEATVTWLTLPLLEPALTRAA